MVHEEQEKLYDILYEEFRKVLNCNSAENVANIPDYVLARYAINAIKELNKNVLFIELLRKGGCQG